MLEFPKEYFQAEEIDGFLVDDTMKKVWAAELEVLNEVAVVCARYGLQWYAAYGTLLGAVRHNGFIPWDDDLDIWMKREDYRKLLEVLADELPEGYVVRAPYARAGYPEYQVYVNNSDSVHIELEHLQRFHGCPFYVGIDIFPLDLIPAEREKKEIQRSIFASTLMLQKLEYDLKNTDIRQVEKENGVAIDDALAQIGSLAKVLEKKYNFDWKPELLLPKRRGELYERLWHLAESLGAESGNAEEAQLEEKLGCQSGNAKESQLAMYLDYIKYGKVYEASWFEVDYLPFEGFDVPVPANYDAVLRVIYGDYMTPRRSGALHDYPCYKKQIKELQEKLHCAVLEDRKGTSQWL